MKATTIALALCTLVVYDGGVLHANSDGKTGRSGMTPGRDCSNCHDGGTAPVVLLSGPQVVAPGSTSTYTLEISSIDTAGGQMFGALDAAANAGSLAATDPLTQLVNGEITHTASYDTRPARNGVVTFEFSWTAPSSPGTATLFAAGLASNGRGTGGDGTGTTMLAITVQDTTPPPVNVPPVAVADADRLSALVGESIQFNGMSSFDPDGPNGKVQSFEWDFGDGSPAAAGMIVSHAYSTIGRHQVTLTVTDADGATGTDTLFVDIAAPGRSPPVAVAGGKYSGVAGEPVQLDGSGSFDSDGVIVSYSWDFGDGTVLDGAEPRPVHTYGAPGEYVVVLVCTDNDGLMSKPDETMASIAPAGPVEPPPDPGPVAFTVRIKAPRRVTIEDDHPVVYGKIKVGVELAGAAPGTVLDGAVFLYRDDGDEPVASQPIRVAAREEGDDDGDGDRDRDRDRDRERDRERDRDRDRKRDRRRHRDGSRLTRVKTPTGIVLMDRRGLERKHPRHAARFMVELTAADAPQVSWYAVVELEGLPMARSELAVTEVVVKDDRGDDEDDDDGEADDDDGDDDRGGDGDADDDDDHGSRDRARRDREHRRHRSRRRSRHR